MWYTILAVLLKQNIHYNYTVTTFSGKKPTQVQNSPVHPVSKDDV